MISNNNALLEAMMGLILRSSLFNCRFYSSLAGQEFDSDENALRDYILRGEGLGLQPNPVFCPSHYRDLRGGLLISCALVDYIIVGSKSGVSPFPGFDAAYP